MLRKLIEFSLQQSALIVIAAALLLVWTGLKVTEMPVDVFPELNAPTVVVMTEAGGLAADEVELNVTFPIETAVNGLPISAAPSRTYAVRAIAGAAGVGAATGAQRHAKTRTAIVRSQRVGMGGRAAYQPRSPRGGEIAPPGSTDRGGGRARGMPGHRRRC